MSVLKTLEMKNTENSLLLENNSSTFHALFDLMANNKLDRLFFLSTPGNLYQLEGIDIDELIFKVLIEKKMESQRAESIKKTISKDISEKISERRAVSFRAGNLGSIDPFDDRKIEIAAKPSINHIYGSYFWNYFAIFDSMKKMYSNMTHSTLKNMFKRIESEVGEVIEQLVICEECGKFSQENSPCEHKNLINLKLLKINPEVKLAWDKAVILPGYISYVLSMNGWDVITEKEIMGYCSHQIDVIAEKDNKIAIFECKNYETRRKIPKRKLMKSFGVMEDIEKLIYHQNTSVNIKKVYATTSGYKRDVAGVENREEVVLLTGRDIFAQPKRWVSKIE